MTNDIMSHYRMPAEWEPHEATWLAWPHFEPHFPGKLEPVPYVYAEIIRVLLPSEKVFVCVNNGTMEQSARAVLKEKGVDFSASNLQFFHIPTNASWSRDHGPIFVYSEKGERVITDWVYNAYGDPWPHDLDDVVPQKVGEQLSIPVVEPKMVLEGGAIDVNGRGTMLTTKECLLNPNRNPGWSQEKIEEYLQKFLGVTKFLWLPGEPLAGDDTSAHIDSMARFVNETTIVCALEDTEKDTNFVSTQKNLQALQKMTDQDGQPFTIIALPMPSAVIYDERQLPATYANFYIGNTVVIVPTFNCANDAKALKILQELFPTRKVVGIDCTDLVWGLGTLHCSTQQQPA